MPEKPYPLPPPPGLKIKFRRARKQLRQLRRIFDRYVAGTPCSYRREVNKEGTHYAYSLLVKPGPTIVELLADEAVHHLRSSLDHLVTALLESNGKRSTDRRFPMADSEPKTPKAIQAFNDCIEGIEGAARELIISAQPYQRGDAAHTHPLWILNRIDNRFKHATLHLFVIRVSFPTVPGIIAPPAGTEGAKSGDVFAYVPITVDVEKDFEPHISADVTFRVSRIGVSGVGIDTLDEIHDFIRDELLGKALSGRLPPRLRK